MLITDYDIGYINNEVINRCSKLTYYNVKGNNNYLVNELDIETLTSF